MLLNTYYYVEEKEDAQKHEFCNNFMYMLVKSFGKWWKSSIKVMQCYGGKEMRSTSCKITKL